MGTEPGGAKAALGNVVLGGCLKVRFDSSRPYAAHPTNASEDGPVNDYTVTLNVVEPST